MNRDTGKLIPLDGDTGSLSVRTWAETVVGTSGGYHVSKPSEGLVHHVGKDC